MVVSSTAIYAADLPAPPPQIVYQPAPCCETGGWYLRGDIGIGVQTYSQFNFTQTNSALSGRRPGKSFKQTSRTRRFSEAASVMS